MCLRRQAPGPMPAVMRVNRAEIRVPRALPMRSTEVSRTSSGVKSKADYHLAEKVRRMQDVAVRLLRHERQRGDAMPRESFESSQNELSPHRREERKAAA